MEKHGGDFYCAFMETFDTPEGTAKRLLVSVDWKDTESLDWQFKAIADTWGLSPEAFSGVERSDTVEKSLLDLDRCLRPIGLSFVEWDTGGDEYIGWIMQANQLVGLTDITPETMRLVYKQVYIADHKFDLSSEKNRKNLTFTDAVFTNCEFTHLWIRFRCMIVVLLTAAFTFVGMVAAFPLKRQCSKILRSTFKMLTTTFLTTIINLKLARLPVIYEAPVYVIRRIALNIMVS